MVVEMQKRSVSFGLTLPDKWREGEEDEARIFGDTYYELENKIVERLRKEVR